MLLTAGLGTRLRPLTEQRPKPIVPLGNRPLACFALDQLANLRVRSVVANTHPMPDLVERVLRKACPPSLNLSFSRESELLGTGGGLRRAWPLFEDPEADVIVMNGDTLFAPDLQRALRLHEAHGAVATMILRPTNDPERFGAIGIDADGFVRSLLGSPARPGLRSLMFTGVHILSPRARASLPEQGCVIRHAYRQWVDRAAPVLGLVDESPWADLGTIAEYYKANMDLASGSRSWPGVVPQDGSLVAADVTLQAGAQIEQSVIGAGAVLGAGVRVERCVVWPETVVRESVCDAIVTPEHHIRLDP